MFLFIDTLINVITQLKNRKNGHNINNTINDFIVLIIHFMQGEIFQNVTSCGSYIEKNYFIVNHFVKK